ncbi:MAG: hypothetical protein GEU82_03270 [Luteitalea sp.]|nr:hypothetical protein [Luteitalea sp.]
MRVLNCSAGGCLLETTRPVTVHTVAALHVSFGGKLFEEVVHVVRSAAVTGGGGLHRVAARFLSTTPPHEGSLRYVMLKESGELLCWLDDPVEE